MPLVGNSMHLLLLGSGNRQIKSHPQYRVLLDLDAHLEVPPIPGVSISDFINTSYEDFVVVKKVVLAKHGTHEVTNV